MNKLLLTSLAIVLINTSVLAQFQLVGFGAGFNAQGAAAIKSTPLEEAIGAVELSFDGAFNSMYGASFVSSYRLAFRSAEKPSFGLTLDLTQGNAFIGGNSNDWWESNDTNYSSYLDFEIYSSVLGLRSTALLQTDPTRRFHFHLGLGLDARYHYGIIVDGRRGWDVWHWPSGYSEFSNQQLGEKSIDPYLGLGVVQQAGAAFRLAKNEDSFPLNQIYLNLDVRMITNFTDIGGGWSNHRSYGGGLSVVYEFRK